MSFLFINHSKMKSSWLPLQPARVERLCRDHAVMAILLNMHIYITGAVLVDMTRRSQCCKIYLHAQLPQNVDQHKDLQLPSATVLDLVQRLDCGVLELRIGNVL